MEHVEHACGSDPLLGSRQGHVRADDEQSPQMEPSKQPRSRAATAARLRRRAAQYLAWHIEFDSYLCTTSTKQKKKGNGVASWL